MKSTSLLFIFIGLALTACAYQRAGTAAIAKSSMIGMTKEQVLTCMGPPIRTAQAGSTEVWSYSSGGDSYSGGAATGYAYGGSATATASGWTKSRSCTVNIILSGDGVTAVNYLGRTGGLLTKGEQCAFAVENCIR